MKFPPYAIRESDSAKVTAVEGSFGRNLTYTINGIEVVPVNGIEKVPHWRSKNGLDYIRVGGGEYNDISEWHYNQTLMAGQLGYETEYVVDYNGQKLVADAYNPETNTIYEFVHSHDEPSKIGKYFELGYNQHWIFERYEGWEQRHHQVNIMHPSKRFLNRSVLSKDTINKLSQLPTIEATYG